MDLLSGFGPAPAPGPITASFGATGASTSTTPLQTQPIQQFGFMQPAQSTPGSFGQPTPASLFGFMQQTSQQPAGGVFGQAPQPMSGFGQQPSLPLGASAMGIQVDGVKLSASQLQAQQAQQLKQLSQSTQQNPSQMTGHQPMQPLQPMSG